MPLRTRLTSALAATLIALPLVLLPAHTRAADNKTSVPPPVSVSAGTATLTPSKPGMLDAFRLKLHHLHTGESIDVAVTDGKDFIPGNVALLNHFLRDHRTQDNADYDTREFQLLHALLEKLHMPNATIDIVCGYRTPQSNNFLRTRSVVTGVAEHSQHMLSKAIDIRIPGVSTLALRNAALSLGMGGVGYYPTSQFVHVDVGPVRQWEFGAKQITQQVAKLHHGKMKGKKAKTEA